MKVTRFRYLFFITIYLSGILIGGIYTPKVIAYAKLINAHKEVEEQKIPKKPQRLKIKSNQVILS